jgi:hypothetical protein
MAPVTYYAMGGGLGHLVRARAVLATLGLETDCHVLSNSVYARDPRVLGPLTAHQPPNECARHPESLARWVERKLHELETGTLFVDVFPGGLLGELTRPLWKRDTRLCYVGRLLRWQTYRARLRANLPRFDHAYLVEPLHPDHHAEVASACGQVEDLSLNDPLSLPAPLPPLPDNTWVVVHSGPLEEVAELVAYGRDIQASEGIEAELRVVGPTNTLGADVLPEFPAAGYFQQARRVITACGFNVMRQSVGAIARHHFMPFARPLDDQFTRAARRRIGEQQRPVESSPISPRASGW